MLQPSIHALQEDLIHLRTQVLNRAEYEHWLDGTFLRGLHELAVGDVNLAQTRLLACVLVPPLNDKPALYILTADFGEALAGDVTVLEKVFPGLTGKPRSTVGNASTRMTVQFDIDLFAPIQFQALDEARLSWMTTDRGNDFDWSTPEVLPFLQGILDKLQPGTTVAALRSLVEAGLLNSEQDLHAWITTPANVTMPQLPEVGLTRP